MMIYEFKCRATGSLVMTQGVAERLLQIIGKSTGAKGIITADSLPAAIKALESAIAAEKAQSANQGAAEPGKNATPEEEAAAISLAQRAFPMLEMMKAAAAAQKDITWGV